MRNISRGLRLAAAAATGLAAAAVGLGQPAQAMNYSSSDLVGWTWTDSAQPSTTLHNPDGDTPVGTSVDAAGVKHTRRAYFTYDLSQYRGQLLHQVSFYSVESSVNDCGTVAPIEVWRTKPLTPTTDWQKPPAEIEQITSTTLGRGKLCPGAYFYNDVAAQVGAAIARHDKTITFEVKIGAAAEKNVKAGRTFQPFALSVWSNTVPVVSRPALLDPGRACGTAVKRPTAGGRATFTVHVTDPDPGAYVLNSKFAVWPVDHPDQRTEVTGGSTDDPQASIDLSGFADGTVLGWAAQASDYDDTSAWSKTCYLTVDNTAPATTPVISSAKYPTDDYPGTGGQGVAGTFVFDGMNDRDIVAFDWSTNLGYSGEVTAKRPGGRAKLSVTPTYFGENSISVRPVDAAGNRGAFTTYKYMVANTAPFVSVDVAGVGLTSHITLKSPAAGVTSYGYTVDGGPETTLTAVNGVGTGDIVFGTRGDKAIVAHAYQGKKLIGAATQYVEVDDAPGVASDDFNWDKSPIAGQAGTFTFTPRSAAVVAYLYDFGDGDQQRIDAAADGTATLTWTPDNGAYYTLSVSSVTADGTISNPAEDTFYVIDPRPQASSDVGQSWPEDDGVGRPVNVFLSSDMPGVSEYVYSFDGGPEQSVPFAYSTSVQVTPAHAGDSTFTVRSKLADGTYTQATTITIHITSGPLVSSAGPLGTPGIVGRAGTVTFAPSLPGVTSYHYDLGDGNGEQTVTAGADGSATVDFTPTYAGWQTITAYSVSDDGTVSDTRLFPIVVDDPAVRVSAGHFGMGVTADFDLSSDLAAVTSEYVWHVDNGPDQTTPATADSTDTYAAYTPDHVGEATFSVRARYTDGTLSPATEITFTIGSMPAVATDTSQLKAGVPSTFTFSGGMPGIVSFDYRFTDSNFGNDLTSGTVAVDASGTAQVGFTPPTDGGGVYYVTVTGHTADGTSTDEQEYWFSVS